MAFGRTAWTFLALVAVAAVGAFATAPAANGEMEPAPARSQEAGDTRLYVLDCGYIFMVDEILEILSLAPDEVPSRDMAVPCYLIEHPQGTLVWDTGLPFAPEAENTLESQLAELGYAFGDITYVAMSHMHGDHAGNANAFKDSIWLAREAEREYAFSGETEGVGWGTPEIYSELEHSETIVIEGDDDHDVFGDGQVVIVSTPGHTPGHCCFHLSEEAILFSGDQLFAGSIGRTDLPGGDYETLMTSMKEKVVPLDDGVTVMPGHGPSTTIGRERRSNPFLGGC